MEHVEHENAGTRSVYGIRSVGCEGAVLKAEFAVWGGSISPSCCLTGPRVQWQRIRVLVWSGGVVLSCSAHHLTAIWYASNELFKAVVSFHGILDDGVLPPEDMSVSGAPGTCSTSITHHEHLQTFCRSVYPAPRRATEQMLQVSLRPRVLVCHGDADPFVSAEARSSPGTYSCRLPWHTLLVKQQCATVMDRAAAMQNPGHTVPPNVRDNEV